MKIVAHPVLFPLSFPFPFLPLYFLKNELRWLHLELLVECGGCEQSTVLLLSPRFIFWRFWGTFPNPIVIWKIEIKIQKIWKNLSNPNSFICQMRNIDCSFQKSDGHKNLGHAAWLEIGTFWLLKLSIPYLEKCICSCWIYRSSWFLGLQSRSWDSRE